MTRKNNNLKKTRTGWREIDVSELERMRQPGYHHINRGLVPEATPTDKTKYEICQNILRYKRENNLSKKEVGERLEIKSTKRLECILYCHIDNFDLNELIEYATKLLGDFELKVVKPGEEVHSITQSKPNDRLRKHL